MAYFLLFNFLNFLHLLVTKDMYFYLLMNKDFIIIIIIIVFMDILSGVLADLLFNILVHVIVVLMFLV